MLLPDVCFQYYPYCQELGAQFPYLASSTASVEKTAKSKCPKAKSSYAEQPVLWLCSSSCYMCYCLPVYWPELVGILSFRNGFLWGWRYILDHILFLLQEIVTSSGRSPLKQNLLNKETIQEKILQPVSTLKE